MKRKEDIVVKLRTLGKHFKSAFQSFARNGWMSVAAVSAVAVTLFLVGGFIAILFNANKFANDVENDVNIRVYVDLAADESEQTALYDRISALDNVNNIEYSNQDEELDNLIGAYGDSFTLFQGDENPLRDVFVVSATDPESTTALADEISAFEYVSDVNYGGASADTLFNIIDNVRIFGIILVVILVVTAFFLIGNTIRITIFSRSTEIEIMRLVGATNWYIRWPFLIEGAIIGVIGAIIPFILITIVYNTAFDGIMGFLAGTSFALIPPVPFLIYLGLGMILTGVLIGIIASYTSVRRFLKI